MKNIVLSCEYHTRKEVKCMYKLKRKIIGEEPEVEHFDTLQEVTKRIGELCNAKCIDDVLKFQKEYNIRFYISRVGGAANE